MPLGPWKPWCRNRYERIEERGAVRDSVGSELMALKNTISGVKFFYLKTPKIRRLWKDSSACSPRAKRAA
jgi:hypothetical protein